MGDRGNEMQELVRATWTSELGLVAVSKKPIESWSTFFLSPVSLVWQSLLFGRRDEVQRKQASSQTASFLACGMTWARQGSC